MAHQVVKSAYVLPKATFQTRPLWSNLPTFYQRLLFKQAHCVQICLRFTKGYFSNTHIVFKSAYVLPKATFQTRPLWFDWNEQVVMSLISIVECYASSSQPRLSWLSTTKTIYKLWRLRHGCKKVVGLGWRGSKLTSLKLWHYVSDAKKKKWQICCNGERQML